MKQSWFMQQGGVLGTYMSCQPQTNLQHSLHILDPYCRYKKVEEDPGERVSMLAGGEDEERE